MAKARVGQTVRFKFGGKTVRGKVVKSLKTIAHVEQTAPKAGAGRTFKMEHVDYTVVSTSKRKSSKSSRKSASAGTSARKPAARKSTARKSTARKSTARKRSTARKSASSATPSGGLKVYRFTLTGRSSKSPRAKYAIEAKSVKEARAKLKTLMAKAGGSTAKKSAAKKSTKKRSTSRKSTSARTSARKSASSSASKPKAKRASKKGGRKASGMQTYRFTADGRSSNSPRAKYAIRAKSASEARAKFEERHGSKARKRARVRAGRDSTLPTVRASAPRGTVREAWAERGTVREAWSNSGGDGWDEFRETVRVDNPRRRPRSLRRRRRW